MRAFFVLSLLACLAPLEARIETEQPSQPSEQHEASLQANNVYDSPLITEDPLAEYGAAAEELHRLHVATEELLDQHTRDIDAVERALMTEIQGLLEEAAALREKEAALLQRSKQLDEMIKQANAIQLDYLAWQLSDTVSREINSRDHTLQETPPVHVEELTNAVYLNDFGNLLDVNKAMSLSKADIEKWLVEIALDEVDLYQHQRSEEIAVWSVANKTQRIKKDCVSPMKAALLVHSLVEKYENDFVGVIDHAKGGSIVHELTSDSFVPPPLPNDLLGNVWWRKYIPQDWERVLPPGWENWNVAVPSEVHHALGIRGSATSPPEAILDESIIPGSCWPMSGAKGYVTIRLPYPVAVSAVTVDHVSPLLLNSSVDASTAPRKIRIIGYPPCSDRCLGLGFDLSRGSVLATFEYEKDGRHIQTFEISGGSGGTSEGECDEFKDIPGSCSAPPGFDVISPDVPSSKNDEVSGIKIEVLSNWGADEYTCLYRFRVHGQAKQ